MAKAKKPASGMYKTKARNLTDAQLKRAKGASAAGKRTVSVSDTSRATTGENKGYTLGPGGKRLTGTVIMANGDRAVYKGGKRVTNVARSSMKDKTPTRTPSRTTSRTTVTSKPKSVSSSLSAAQKAKILKDKKVSAQMGGRKPILGSGRTATPSQRGEGSSSTSSGSSSSSSSGKKWWQQGGGGLAGPNSPFAGNKSSSPRKSNIKVGARVGNKVWNGTRWVTKSK